MKTKLTLTFLCALILAMCRMSFAQGTEFTYQGRVTDNGTNFTGAGQFKFALVTSTNASRTATATANAPSNGYITGYTIVDGGHGYLTAPAVTVSGGGGSGAAGVAVISGGAVTGITVTSTGDGQYTSAPTVTIAPPPASIAYTTYWSNDGTSTAGSEPNAAAGVNVNNGLFTVALGDATLANMTAINPALFVRPDLQLRIWFNDGVNGFAALDPAQTLTAAPYAVVAENASNVVGTVRATQLSGTIPSAQLAGVYSNAMVSLQNVNGFLPAETTWSVTGNNSQNFPYFNDSVVSIWNSGESPALRLVSAGSSTPDGALSVSANNLTGPIAQFGNANAIVASIQNDGSIDAPAFNGSGAGLTSLNASRLTNGLVPSAVLPNGIGGSSGNSVSGNNSVVGGGQNNTASAGAATVSGGLQNSAGANYASVGGGYGNIAGNSYATVGGGIYNHADGFQSTVSGGGGNQATNQYAAVPGGQYNVAGGQFSFAAGQRAKAVNQGAFVWADSQNADFSSTANDQFSVRAQGGARFVTSGAGMTVDGQPVWTSGGRPGLFETGQATNSGSATVETNLTVTFPTAFGSAPKILVSVANDPGFQDVNDTFVVSVSSNSASAFRVNIVRVDSPTGWSQHLRINWQAWQ